MKRGIVQLLAALRKGCDTFESLTSQKQRHFESLW